jgi:DNA-binding winged helix-turn-helix (wHTH) protein
MESVKDQSAPASCVDFAGFRLDPRMRLLYDRAGLPVPLSSRALSTLLFLVENQGETVSKQQLMDAVWPNSVVEENNLSQAISALRKALGDNKGKHRIILTIPGRGYSFVSTVRPVAVPEALELDRAQQPEAAPPRPLSRYSQGPVMLWTLLVLGMVLLGLVAHKLGTNFIDPNDDPVVTTRSASQPAPMWDERGADGAQLVPGSDSTPTALRALGADLLPPGMQNMEWQPTASAEAYQAYLSGTAALVPGDYKAALRWFELAVECDPEFIEALVSLSMLHSLLAAVPVTSTAEHRQQALAMARRALAVDPANGYAHAMLAAALHSNGQWLRAEDEYRLARDFGADVDSMEMQAMLRMALGDFASARKILHTALQETPDNLNVRGVLMVVEEYLGDRKASREVYEAGEALQPYPAWWGDVTGVWLALGRNDHDFLQQAVENYPAYLLLPVLQVLGDREVALSRLRLIQQDAKQRPPAQLVNAAMFAAWYGDKTLALDLLATGLADNWISFYIVWLPVFDDLRKEEGFKEMLRASGIVDYWRTQGWPSTCKPLSDEQFECRWSAATSRN